MSNYSRFVSYLYEYKDGTKSENRGFVKVEARDNLGKIEIHIKAPSQPANIPLKVYGFIRKDSRLPSILLGTCSTGRNTTFCKLQINTENIGGTAYNFSDISGLLIFCENDVCYGTSWDDHPIIVSTYDDITPPPRPEPISQPQAPEPQEMPTVELNQDLNEEPMNEPADNLEMETPDDMMPSDTQPFQETAEDYTEQLQAAETTAADDERSAEESALSDEQIQSTEELESSESDAELPPEAEDPISVSEQSRGSEETAFTCEPDEASEDLVTVNQQPLTSDNAGPAYEQPPMGRAIPLEPPLSDNRMFSDEQKFPRDENFFNGGPFSGNLVLAKEQQFSGNMMPPPINRPISQNMMSFDDQQFMETPMPPGSPQMPRNRMPAADQPLMENPMPSGSQQMPQNRIPGTDNQFMNNIMPELDTELPPEAIRLPGTQTTGRTIHPPARRVNFSGMVTPAQQSVIQERMPYDDQQFSRNAQSSTEQPLISKSWENNLQDDPQQYYQADTDEPTYAPQELQSASAPCSNKGWNQLHTSHANISPFQDDEIMECIQLDLNDLQAMNQNNWGVGNNRFLLHCYSNYQHLIMGKTDRCGRAVFVLGVPGTYDPREKYMANMFGFPYFKSCKNKCRQNGEFGYWYRPIN